MDSYEKIDMLFNIIDILILTNQIDHQRNERKDSMAKLIAEKKLERSFNVENINKNSNLLCHTNTVTQTMNIDNAAQYEMIPVVEVLADSRSLLGNVRACYYDLYALNDDVSEKRHNQATKK